MKIFKNFEKVGMRYTHTCLYQYILAKHELDDSEDRANQAEKALNDFKK